jgi:SAM-dependent methyltransferase
MTRDETDFFETPAWAVHAILPHLPHLPSGGRVLDPGCGTGAILRALTGKAPLQAGVLGPPFELTDLYGVELDPARAEKARRVFFAARLEHHVTVADFLLPSGETFDLVVGNPPYSLALEFVERSLELTRHRRGTVAMLLRLCWLGSQERASFHREHPSDVYVLPRRPSFCLSVSCKNKKAGCSWRVVLPTDAERPRACGACGAGVTVTTSDATEYGWFVFGPGRGNRWQILEVP